MPTSPLDSKAALVVDGHAGIREMVSEILESRNCAVRRAHDRLEALAFAAAGAAFDLLVVVIAMPHADSISLAEELLRQRPALKVLFITGRTDGTEFPLATRPDIRLLEKPFDPTELIEAAEHLFSGDQRIRTAKP